MSWLRGLPVAVVDVETTGLDPATSHVVEVAVVRIQVGEGMAPAWSTRIRPPVPIPPEATRIHGISDADVADAPTFAEVAADLLAAIGGADVAAWNAPFDYGMLRAELVRLDSADFLDWPWLDPMVWSRDEDRFAKGGHSLSAVCRRRGIDYPAHGATADATATALLVAPLLRDVWPRYRWPDPDSLLRWQTSTALAQERDLCRWLADRGREPPSCPWHRLAGLPAPVVAPPPPARLDRCWDCGAPIRWVVAADGSVTAHEPESTTPHECRRSA